MMSFEEYIIYSIIYLAGYLFSVLWAFPKWHDITNQPDPDIAVFIAGAIIWPLILPAMFILWSLYYGLSKNFRQ